MGGNDYIFIAQYRVTAFDHTQNIFSSSIGIIGSIHFDVGSLSGMERGRLLSLINLPDGLFISLACSPENIINHSVCNMTIDKSRIIGGIRTGNPFV